MKIGILNLFTLFSLLFLTLSCVQGPMDLSSITLQDFPQLSSSSPVGSSLSLTDEDDAKLFSISITNNSTEGFRTQWTLNGLVVHASSNQLTYSFSPNALDTGLGIHTLVVTVYSSDGSKILGSRTWYITVQSAIQVTGQYPLVTDSIQMTNGEALVLAKVKVNGALQASSFGVKVNRSIFDGEKLASVQFFHKSNLSSSCTDEANPACAMTAYGAEQELVDNDMMYFSAIDPTFAINYAPAEGPSQLHQIVAKIYHKEPAPSTDKVLVGNPIVWNVEVVPVNQRPEIAFSSGDLSSTKSISVPHDSPISLSFITSDRESTAAQISAQFSYYISSDNGVTWNPMIDIEGHALPACDGAGITSCSITLPSHSIVAGNPTPLATTDKKYKVVVSVQDNGLNSSPAVPLNSRSLSWILSPTELQTSATVNITTPATTTYNEGTKSEVAFTVTDAEYDNYCVEVIRKSDGKVMTIRDDTTSAVVVDDTKYCPADKGVDLFTALGTEARKITIQIPYDTVSLTDPADKSIVYILRFSEVLSNVTATSTTQDREFSLQINNVNPAPVIDTTDPLVTIPLTNGGVFEVVTGAEFTISPGKFSDISYISGATNIENKLYYTWQVAQAAAAGDCSAGPYADIPLATNEGFTPIELTDTPTAYASMDLNWTPPATSDGYFVCFRLCYRDDGETGCAHSADWTGPLGTGIVVARSNISDLSFPPDIVAINKIASISNIKVFGTGPYIASTTYSAITESADNSYKIISQTHSGFSHDIAGLMSTTFISPINMGATVEILKLGIAADSTFNTFIVSALVKESTLDHYVVHVNIHDNTGLLTNSFVLDAYAREMGDLIYDDANWFIPYIESTNRNIIMVKGTTAVKTSEDTLSYFGDTNKAVKSIRYPSTSKIIMALTKDDDSLNLHQIDYSLDITDSATYDYEWINPFSSNILSKLQLIAHTSDFDAHNDFYLAAINQSSSQQIALARIDIDDPANSQAVKATIGASLQSITDLQIQIVDNTLILGTLNDSGNLYASKVSLLDDDNDAWTIAKTSHQINPLGENINSTIVMTPAIPSYGLSDLPAPIFDYYGDTLFFIYQTPGPEVHSAAVNLTETQVTTDSESAVDGYHPGFF